MKIQKTFTDIRNYLNKREDELLSKVDNEFDKLVIDENKIKDLEKLPNKVKISIDKVNNINHGWDDENKLCSLINEY